MEASTPGLEPAMQELEALEAPGWWTAAGIAAGVVVTGAAVYGGWAASAALIAT